MRAKRLIECATRLVFQRCRAYLRDRHASRFGGGSRPGEMLEHMCKIAFAAFVGGTVALDEPSAARKFKPESSVLPSALHHSIQPGSDGLLFSLIAAAPGTNETQ